MTFGGSKNAPQEFFTSVSCKSAPQRCRTRAFHKSVPQECSATRASHKSAQNSFHKSVLQECATGVSNKIWPCVFDCTFACGFVGSILFVTVTIDERMSLVSKHAAGECRLLQGSQYLVKERFVKLVWEMFVEWQLSCILLCPKKSRFPGF